MFCLISEQWNLFLSQLSRLSYIYISRHIGILSDLRITLLGFADASEHCYDAAVFVKISDTKDDPGRVSLVCSKYRITPLKRALRLSRSRSLTCHSSR